MGLYTSLWKGAKLGFGLPTFAMDTVGLTTYDLSFDQMLVKMLY
jgi:hypothetical protein